MGGEFKFSDLVIFFLEVQINPYKFLNIWDTFTYDTFSRSRHLFFWRQKSYTIHLLTCFIRRILWRLWSKNRTMQQMIIKTVCLKSFSFLFWKHLHICEIPSWRLNIIRLKLQGHCEHIKLDSTAWLVLKVSKFQN